MTPDDMPGLLFFLAAVVLLALVLHLRREVARRTRLIRSLADRMYAQSELLARRAERDR